MHDLNGKRVAILATHGFEQSELEVPLQKLREAGATVEVVSPESGEIKGWDKKDWGRAVPVDRALDGASEADYDALVLPGGQMNPDTLRANETAVNFVKSFWNAKKPIGAICHGPWLLVEAGIAEGRRMTSYGSIKTDVINAGGLWEDSEVVTDQGLVTSRKPDDLPAFCAKVAEEIAEGKHERRL
ncbi:protease [Nitratireductor aestuarii]|uniref:Protease n=1 Tax=Nitratireductor aestuarii TaxID=1735103 RepID=A0A916W6S1_9HYPH|nr:type 1 glutamine amidotransferase domain-containing protein [Nitratireductor aestuarii]GGA71985.1 protease [Nitratireductor aestuarii]